MCDSNDGRGLRRATRREVLTACAAGAWSAPLFAAGMALPREVPAGVGAIIANTLQADPAAFNTDWFGTLLVKGMLEWGRKHVPEARGFAARWFDYHARSGRIAPYGGNKSRGIVVGGIPITTYAGHYGLCFPCLEIYRQLRDERARKVCVDIADVILHEAARNRFGLVAHDDFVDWAIPDTCYFAVSALMAAAEVDEAGRRVYQKQAVFQLRTYIDTFLVPETGLAKTVLFRNGLGKTYWTRASGWLLWAMAAVMRGLPSGHPAMDGFVRDLRKLADGMTRVQDATGAMRLYLNDPSSPLETTGTAMAAMGMHEAIRRKWLPASYSGAVDRAWSYVKNNITPEGAIRGAYTPYAIPAERGEVKLETQSKGWIPGFILSTAYEMTAA